MKHTIILLLFSCVLWGQDKKIIISGRTGTMQKGLLDTCKTKECLMQVIKNNPNDTEAHWWLGTKLQAEHNYLQAIDEFDIVTKLDSTFNMGYPYRDRANCKNNLRNDSGAVVDMNAAIRLNPTERYFYDDRATYQYNLFYLNKLSSNEAACLDWQKALELGLTEAKGKLNKYCK